MAKKPTTKKASGTATAAKPKAKTEAPKTTALSKTEAKQLAKGFAERWQKTTDNLRGRRRKAAADILQYRYDVGVFAIQIVEDRNKLPGKQKYGSRTVEQICEALEESQSTVHTCIKFARKCDKKELEYFKAHEWPWRAVSSIVTVEDAKAYKQLKEKFEKDQFANTDALKEAVKGANEKSKKDGTKTDNRGGSPTAQSVVKSFSTACTQITTKVMPDFMSVVKSFTKDSQKMEAEVADKMAAGIKEGKKALASLSKMVDRAEVIIGEAGV